MSPLQPECWIPASSDTADVGLGFLLLIAAGPMAAGNFDVGKLAVFTAYLSWLSFLPRMVGRVLARRKQAGVAFERMSGLVADCDASNTVRPQVLPVGRREQRPRIAPLRPPRSPRSPRSPLRMLELRGLSAEYSTGGGVRDVCFTIEKGSFTVLTGPIGADNITLGAMPREALLRALDVETELELWANLAAAGMTVLAVSHRAVAIDRADQVLRLEAGRLVAHANR